MQGPILELVVVRDFEDTIRVSISDISSANSRYNICLDHKPCPLILNGRLIGHQFVEPGTFGPCRGHFH